MFLSNILKSHSNKLSAMNLALKSKNQLISPLLKIQFKNVSRSQTSRDNREKYDLKKMDDYWEKVDKEYNRRLDIAKEIEEKYKINNETLISSSAGVNGEIKEIYFVPLTKNDEKIIQTYIKPERHEGIRRGGRLVLLDEINRYNKKFVYKKIDFDFEPLDYNDFEILKRQYSLFVSNKDIFVFVLQRGKKIFNFIKEFQNLRKEILYRYSSLFRKIDHTEAMEDYKLLPLKNNIEIDLKKVESSKWIKKLFEKNKLTEEKLEHKFTEIYSDFLDYINKEAAFRRQYDVEFIAKEETEKTRETAKKAVKENLEKISKFLDTIEIFDTVQKKTDGTLNFTNSSYDESSQIYTLNKNIRKDLLEIQDEMILLEAAMFNNVDKEILEEINKRNKENKKEKPGETAEEKALREEKAKKIQMLLDTLNQSQNQSETSKKIQLTQESKANAKIEKEPLAIDAESILDLNSIYKCLNEVVKKTENDAFGKVFDNLKHKGLKDIKQREKILQWWMKYLKFKVDYLRSFEAGRLILKLAKKEQDLSEKLNLLEAQDEPWLLNYQDESNKIDNMIHLIKEASDKMKRNTGFNILSLFPEKKKDINNKTIISQFILNPIEYLSNIYIEMINYVKANNRDFKLPEKKDLKMDIEDYLLNVFIKFYADLSQSKHQKFTEKELRLNYFGDLKAYKWYEEAQNRKEEIHNELTDEEKINPINYFTPNFKKLLDHLNKKFGIIDKTIYDYEHNIESSKFNYPDNVMDLGVDLFANDVISQEIVNFYFLNEANTPLNKQELSVVEKVVLKDLKKFKADLLAKEKSGFINQNNESEENEQSSSDDEHLKNQSNNQETEENVKEHNNIKNAHHDKETLATKTQGEKAKGPADISEKNTKEKPGKSSEKTKDQENKDKGNYNQSKEAQTQATSQSMSESESSSSDSEFENQSESESGMFYYFYFINAKKKIFKNLFY